jgi:hypothetical protein
MTRQNNFSNHDNNFVIILNTIVDNRMVLPMNIHHKGIETVVKMMINVLELVKNESNKTTSN